VRGRSLFVLSVGAVLVSLLGATVLPAQVSSTVRDRTIREARELARMGDREAAIHSVESLYARAPMDGVIVQSLAGLLVEAGETERAKKILGDYTAKRSDDTGALAALATLNFQSGDRQHGMEVLERIIGRAPDELWPYQLGLDAMMDAEMDEDMITFIKRARLATGDSTLFAVDAAGLHRDARRFGAAAREYLRASLAKNMSSEIATDYIVTMAEDEAARPVVIEALRLAMPIGPFTRTVTRSLAEIYLMDEDCAVALEMISGLVDLAPESADVLIAFARKASQAGCFGECARAYRLVLDHVDEGHKAAEYLVEKARCEKAAGMPEEAMATFDTVAKDYPTYKAADDALMGRALILRDRGELDAAIAEAERMLKSKYTDNVFKAVLFKAECQVLMGDLDNAFNTYDEVSGDWTAEYAQEAYFNMGEINLYRGEFDDAQAYYNVTLRQYADEARANDAIDRLLLIKSCGSEGRYTPELVEFARALLLLRQGDTVAAAALFRKLGAVPGDAPIRTESLKALAEMYVEGGRLEEAVRTYKLIGDSLDTPASASALEAVGDIYLDSGRTEEAVRAYEDVILKFPESVSAGDARRKIGIATRGTDDET
jgi:tetratricopeptide (TPR) repeat protein